MIRGLTKKTSQFQLAAQAMCSFVLFIECAKRSNSRRLVVSYLLPVEASGHDGFGWLHWSAELLVRYFTKRTNKYPVQVPCPMESLTESSNCITLVALTIGADPTIESSTVSLSLSPWHEVLSLLTGTYRPVGAGERMKGERIT